jgi:AcrR family transcriptional regulator
MGDQKPTKRPYRLKKRADEMADTRRRITEAAVDLHGTVGPARTTVSAIAERAGVQRHTVYRHFPGEAELFAACSSHYFAAHPLPDIDPWRAIADTTQRLARALDELYGYYEQTEPMLSNVLRDAELVDPLRPTLVPLQAYLAAAVEILAVGRPVRGRRRSVLAAALYHAVDFVAWRSLTAGKRITRAEAVELVGALVEGASRPTARAAR